MSSQLFSAQVILDAKQHSQAEEVAAFFRARGFEVGPLRTGGMPITAPIEAFADLLGVTPNVREVMAHRSNELPIAALPPALRKYISRVVFTTVDFGPGDF